MHLPCLFKKVILQKQIAVIGSFGVLRRFFDNIRSADHKGQSCHSHKTLLRGSHAEIYIFLIHIYRAHSVGRGGVNCKDSIVLMRQCSDLADRVKDACSRFVVGSVYQSNIGVFLQCLFHKLNVGRTVNRHLQVNMRHTVIPAYLHSSCAVSAVIDYKNFLALGQQGIKTHVNIYGTRTAEQNGGIILCLSVNDLHQIISQPFHHRAELLFSGADIGNHLRHFYRVGGGGRTGIKQNISFDFHKILL